MDTVETIHKNCILVDGGGSHHRATLRSLPYSMASWVRSSPVLTEIINQRDPFTSMFLAALSTITKLWKWPKGPLTDEWIRRVGIYIYYSVIKRETLPFVTIWMNLGA